MEHNHDRPTEVGYALIDDIEARFRAALRTILDGGARRVCDVGGGANPIVPVARIRELGLEYVVLDESSEQLGRAPADYRCVQASILDAEALSRVVHERGPFDAVFSRWTAEHIPDGKAFHEHVFELLAPGGTAVHLCPTLYSFPFVVNRVLTPGMSAALLFRTHPARKNKFLPYYSWCRGPSNRQLRRLEQIGYSVEAYTGFFGHNFYARLPPLHRAHRRVASSLVEHPLPSMTSFALMVLRRPA